MFWVIALVTIGVALGWVKIRRQRKASGQGAR